ncbi:MAG: glycosyltransferase family 2 protein [Nitriliruptorales bacterium]|nr:glycosyltransferase family 2 protein [Nitriliruptorales bacterium]
MSPIRARGGHARVVAIVINHNGADHLEACLASLAAQTEPLDIVVVDNASTDGSTAILDAAAEDVGVVRNPTNRGYAGGANDGLAHTDHPFVLLLNPDVVLAPDHVRALVAALDANPSVGSAQGRLLRREPGELPSVDQAVMDSAGHAIRRSRLFRNRGEGQPATAWAEPAAVFGVTGAACLHRRSMLEDIAITRADGRREVFDERLFAYFEDVDLDWRARLRGWSARYVPDAIGWHERGGRGPRRSALVEELNFANRLLVLAKHDVLSVRALPLLVATTLAKAVMLHPRVLFAAVRRIRRGWRPARRDRRQIRAAATVPPGEIARRWVEPPRLGRQARG